PEVIYTSASLREQIPEFEMYLFKRISSESVFTFGFGVAAVFLKGASFFTNLEVGFFPNFFSPVGFSFPEDFGFPEPDLGLFGLFIISLVLSPNNYQVKVLGFYTKNHLLKILEKTSNK